jgi:hypothetical protein
MTVTDPCRRTDGSFRKAFRTLEEAREYATVNPSYFGDVEHVCGRCGHIHLSKPEWLIPEHHRMVVGVH